MIVAVLAGIALANWRHLDDLEVTARLGGNGQTNAQIAIMRLNLISSMMCVPLLGAIFWVVLRCHKRRRAAEMERDCFFKFSLDLFTIADTDWNFRQVNPAFTRTLGWSAEELVSRPFSELVHPDDRNVTLAEMKNLAAGELTTHFENRYQCKDGSWKMLEWHARPRPDGTIYAAARDVTDVKAGANAVGVSDALRNAVLNSMLANIAVVDREGTLIAINEGWKSFARENGSDASLATVGVGANYLDVCLRAVPELGDEMQEVEEGVRSVLEGRQATYEHDYPCDSPDERRWFNMNVSPLARKEGGAVITHLNRTRRKLAELALRESEEKFRLIADNNADVIWLGNPGMTKILYVNEAYERIWGRSCQSLYESPRSFLEPLHPLDRDRVLQAKEQATEDGWETEYRIVRPDGTIRWIKDRGYPIRDEEGRIYRLTGVAMDITRRKGAEAAMAEKPRSSKPR